MEIPKGKKKMKRQFLNKLFSIMTIEVEMILKNND